MKIITNNNGKVDIKLLFASTVIVLMMAMAAVPFAGKLYLNKLKDDYQVPEAEKFIEVSADRISVEEYDFYDEIPFVNDKEEVCFLKFSTMHRNETLGKGNLPVYYYLVELKYSFPEALEEGSSIVRQNVDRNELYIETEDGRHIAPLTTYDMESLFNMTYREVDEANYEKDIYYKEGSVFFILSSRDLKNNTLLIYRYNLDSNFDVCGVKSIYRIKVSDFK